MTYHDRNIFCLYAGMLVLTFVKKKLCLAQDNDDIFVNQKKT